MARSQSVLVLGHHLLQKSLVVGGEVVAAAAAAKMHPGRGTSPPGLLGDWRKEEAGARLAEARLTPDRGSLLLGRPGVAWRQVGTAGGRERALPHVPAHALH